LSIVKEKYGAIYFDIAEPISAKEFFGPVLDRSVHNLRPLHQQEITEEEKKLVPKLAHEIVYRQQKHCVITTFNLLAIVLHNNLIKGKDLLNVEEIIEEIVWLKGIVEALGGFVCIDNVQKNVLDALEVHQNIVALTSDGKVTLVSNEIVLDKANITKLKGHELSEKTITLSVPFMMLQIYINPVLHYFVDVAVLVIILKNHERAVLGNFFLIVGLCDSPIITCRVMILFLCR
jgi:glycerol-3-phosphate O-acyltransferase